VGPANQSSIAKNKPGKFGVTRKIGNLKKTRRLIQPLKGSSPVRDNLRCTPNKGEYLAIGFKMRGTDSRASKALKFKFKMENIGGRNDGDVPKSLGRAEIGG